MKNVQTGTSTSSGRSSSWALLIAFVFALGFVFPRGALATGGGPSNRGGDDETIGTLPIVGNQGQHLQMVRHLRDVRPDFYVEGAYDELLSTIIGFTGTGTVTYETLPAGQVRLGFHGQLELQLDRGLVQVTGVRIGVSVPTAYHPAQAWSGFAGQAAAFRLRAGDLPLPVPALDSQDLLEQAPWVFGAHSRSRGGFQLHALSEGSVLYVGQTY